MVMWASCSSRSAVLLLVAVAAAAGVAVGQHPAGSPKLAEHNALLALVPPGSYSHTAAASGGSWSASGSWAVGGVPSAGADVHVPAGSTVTYDVAPGAGVPELRTVFVEGTLRWNSAASTEMRVDTLIVGPGGVVEIGTEASPVPVTVSHDVVFPTGTDVDVAGWDPTFMSRGFISHGTTTIFGAPKTPWSRVSSTAAAPMAGDDFVVLDSAPDLWQVGDQMVVAGTLYDGYKWNNTARRTDHFLPEDEVVTITAVAGDRVTFTPALRFDHAGPAGEPLLRTAVGLLTRNVRFAVDDVMGAPAHRRAHAMFMHSRTIDIRYAEFAGLGRTDKSFLAQDGGRVPGGVTSTSNVKGRYGFHFHRNLPDDRELWPPYNISLSPAIAIGNSVHHSPGWCMVHHDSYAIMDSNFAYDCFGSSIVSETGNEVGSWTRNLAIYSKGVGWGDPKNMLNLTEFDTGNSGDCFWFQSRMVRTAANLAASCDNAYSYFHRGALDRTDGASQLSYDARAFEFPTALALRTVIAPDDAPIRQFVDNEAFAVRTGLHVVKANPSQNHDVHSQLDRLTVWSCRHCAEITYTAHYLLRDFRCWGRVPGAFTGAQSGISIENNAGDIVILNATIHDFPTGIYIRAPDEGYDRRNYVIVNPTFVRVTDEFQGRDPANDILLQNYNIVPQVSMAHGVPLRYIEGGNPSTMPWIRRVIVNGTKTDSLGTIEIPPIGDAGPDNYNAPFSEVLQRLNTAGYFYDVNSGTYKFVLDDFYTDRGTGDLLMQGSWVELDANVISQFGSPFFSYPNVVFRGNISIPDAPPTTMGECADTAVETDVTIDLLANDADPDGDVVTLAAVGQPERGIVFRLADGRVTVRPDLGFVGTISFDYWVTDSHANFVKANARVYVGGSTNVCSSNPPPSSNPSGSGSPSSGSGSGSGSSSGSTPPAVAAAPAATTVSAVALVAAAAAVVALQ